MQNTAKVEVLKIDKTVSLNKIPVGEKKLDVSVKKYELYNKLT